ncbi:transposase [Flavobacterium daemonense]|uniref:transposase n=1 Tax=Flavobacterium daemonense TaxID=1393049 RepID=UPI001185818D|nr:transposase [Flavobacterium daemonense]KAF2337032.1 hypothetical protein FND99_01100 [Flavobacterium daemonense]
MSLYKDKFKIDSARLKNWDYSSEAVYFITIVTKGREYFFGSIEDGKMTLNENGIIVENELLKSIKIRKNWFFHNWIVMPNHIHLLIEIQKQILNTNELPKTDDILNTTNIVEAHSSASPPSISTTKFTKSLSTNVAETHCCAPLRYNRDEKQSLSKLSNESNLSRKPNSISSFVAIFKSVTTTKISGYKFVWQANYHDHIVRNYKRFEIIYDHQKQSTILGNRFIKIKLQ